MLPKLNKDYLLEAVSELPRHTEYWQQTKCMLYPFNITPSGYGNVSISGKLLLVHRFTYEQFHGIVLGKRRITALCNERSCFNPLHYRPQYRQIDFLEDTVKALMDDPSVPWWFYPCIEWPHLRDVSNYGFIQQPTGTKDLRVNRKVVELTTEKSLPESLYALHRCDNPPCFRASHLFIGTMKDNVADMISKGRDRYHDERPTVRGEKHHSAVLTWKMVQEMRSEYAGGLRPCVIADSRGLDRSHVHRILKKKAWKKR